MNEETKIENVKIEERKKIAEMLESWMDDADKPFHKIAQVEKLILRLKKGELPGGA